MPGHSIWALVVATVVSLGFAAGAVADVVPLQGGPFNPEAESPLDEPRRGVAGDSDPFLELTTAGTLDVEMQAPLLELLGMPTPRARRETAAGYGLRGQAEPASGAGEQSAQLASSAALGESDDGLASLGRKALEIYGSLGGPAEPGEPSGGRLAAEVPEPQAARSTGGAEGRSSWLREGMQLLRDNREWVLAALFALFAATVTLRRFSQPREPARPRGRGRAPTRLAR